LFSRLNLRLQVACRADASASAHHASAWSSALASIRSCVSKPSVNQP
jgi:hypothetical protein